MSRIVIWTLSITVMLCSSAASAEETGSDGSPDAEQDLDSAEAPENDSTLEQIWDAQLEQAMRPHQRRYAAGVVSIVFGGLILPTGGALLGVSMGYGILLAIGSVSMAVGAIALTVGLILAVKGIREARRLIGTREQLRMHEIRSLMRNEESANTTGQIKPSLQFSQLNTPEFPSNFFSTI